MTVNNNIIPVVQTREKACDRHSKDTAVGIQFWKLCTAAVNVDIVNNIHNFWLQIHILAN